MDDFELEQERDTCEMVPTSVTPERLEDVICGEQYYVFPGTTVTVCCLTLENGFNSIGESACVSPHNFNAAKGREIARDNAKEKLWVLEGYLLRSRLSHGIEENHC